MILRAGSTGLPHDCPSGGPIDVVRVPCLDHDLAVFIFRCRLLDLGRQGLECAPQNVKGKLRDLHRFALAPLLFRRDWAEMVLCPLTQEDSFLGKGYHQLVLHSKHLLKVPVGLVSGTVGRQQERFIFDGGAGILYECA